MPRRKYPVVRNREAFAGPGRVVVRCECGKRLGERWPVDQGRSIPRTGQRIGAMDGPWYVPTHHGTYHAGEEPGVSRARWGLKHVAFEDWLSVECTACGREWQGREWQVDALGLAAVERGTRDVVLMHATGLDAPPPGPPSTSRDW